jgi:nitroimidazol reductase NimA-like FMN-containing flavoprotein (pyridoxamine 5'-phosphate oxidase superfamily)
MPEIEPVAQLSPFSSKDAVATAWAQARGALQDADVYWLSTVRQDGRPHVTPFLGVWVNGALHFCTGSTERKAKNLAENRHCVLTTGCNDLE